MQLRGGVDSDRPRSFDEHMGAIAAGCGLQAYCRVISIFERFEKFTPLLML